MSLSHWRGFIGLSPYSAAAAQLNPLPLSNWTNDMLQNQRIERIWPVCELPGWRACPVGRGSCYRFFFQDLYKTNSGFGLDDLKVGKDLPGPMKGTLMLQHPCDDLATRDAFPSSFVFRRARELVTGAGKDVAECLKLGLVSMKILYFPAIKYRDIGTRKILTWNFVDYMEVHDVSQKPRWTYHWGCGP